MKLLTLILVLISSLARAMPIYTVTSINATVLSGTSVRVDWTDVSTIAGYTVERCSSNCTLITGSWTLVGLIPQNIKSFTDTGLTPGTTYRWRVAEDPYMSASATPTSTTTTTTVTTTTTTGTGSTTTTLTGNILGFIPSSGLSAFDIVIDSNRAYVASGQFGFSILDVTGSSSIPSLGTSPIPFTGNRVNQSGTIACVIQTAVAIHFFDVTSATAPVYKSKIPGTYKSCVVSGNTVYAVRVGSGNPPPVKFSVIDVSNLTVPVTSTEIDLNTGTGAVTETHVSGNTAYVAVGTSGIKIIDITTPSAPQLLTTFDTSGTVTDIAVSGSALYVADTTQFLKVNVTTPSSPSLSNTLPTAATAVIISGTTAYVTDGQNLKVINISGTPTLTSTTNVVSTGGGVSRLAYKSPLVYMADSSGSAPRAIFSYNVSNPISPTVGPINFQNFQNNGTAVNTAKIGVVVNGGAFLPSNIPGMKVVDVNTNSTPVVRGTLNDLNRPMYGAAINGNTVYTTENVAGNPPHTDFLTVDISSPASPAIRGRVTLPAGLYVGGGAADGITFNGTNAYAATSTAGLQTVNVSNITNPTLGSVVDTPGQAASVIYDSTSGRVFVCDLTAFLAINVSTNQIIGSLPINATHAAIANGKAYVGDGINLRVVNISNPTAMSQIGSTINAKSARFFAISGNRLFGNASSTLGHPTNPLDPDGVQIWDISTTTPVFIKQVVVPGWYLSFASVNSLIYVGDNASIIDVLSPTN